MASFMRKSLKDLMMTNAQVVEGHVTYSDVQKFVLRPVYTLHVE